MCIRRTAIGLIWPFSVVLLSMLTVTILAQDTRISALDTFSSKIHRGETFAEAIRRTRDRLPMKDAAHVTRQLDRFMDSISNYSFENTAYLRQAFARHAHFYSNKIKDLRQAKKYYLKAHHAIPIDAVSEDTWVWHIENPLAALYNQFGDVSRAAHFYRLAESALLNQNDIRVIRLWGNMGIFYQSQQDFSNARLYYRKGIHKAAIKEYRLGEALNRLNLASAMTHQGAYGSAGIQLDSMAHLLSDRDIYSRLIDSYLNLKGQIAMHHQDTQGALQYFKDCIVKYDSLHTSGRSRQRSKYLLSLCRGYMKIKDFEACANTLLLAFQSLEPRIQSIHFPDSLLYPETIFMDLFALQGKMYFERFKNTNDIADIDHSKQSFYRALNINKIVIDEYDTDESKFAAAFFHRNEVNSIIPILFEEKKITGQLDQDALQYFLNESQSIVLDEKLKKRLALDQLSPARFNEYVSNQLTIAQLQRKELEEGIVSSGEILDRSRQNQQLIDHIDVKTTHLNSPFVHYIVTRDAIYCVDNFRNALKLTRLGAVDSLDVLLSKCRGNLLNPESIEQYTAGARALYDALLGPLGKLPNQFSVIGEDKIHQIPFGALVDGQQEYLIRNHQIDYRLSLLVYSKKKSKKSIPDITCVSPDYGDAPTPVVGNRMEMYPLKFTEQEKNAIKSLYPHCQFTAEIEDPLAFFCNEEMDIFHFAGHARSGKLKGSLILNKEGDYISGTEIAQLPTQLHLAVLSACETGLGKSIYGEGVLSMARAFILNGTGHVVNSLWTVNDQATSLIMAHFYRHLKDENDPGKALQLAKQDYLIQAEDNDAHPYYWAGLVLTTSAVTSEHQLATSTIVVGFVLLVLLSLLMFKNFTR